MTNSNDGLSEIRHEYKTARRLQYIHRPPPRACGVILHNIPIKPPQIKAANRHCGCGGRR